MWAAARSLLRCRSQRAAAAQAEAVASFLPEEASSLLVEVILKENVRVRTGLVVQVLRRGELRMHRLLLDSVSPQRVDGAPELLVEVLLELHKKTREFPVTDKEGHYLNIAVERKIRDFSGMKGRFDRAAARAWLDERAKKEEEGNE